MPDGTTRFSKDGQPIYHSGTSTFSEYTVLPEISIAKVDPAAPPGRGLPAGLRRHHRHRRRDEHRQGERGESVAIFGLGASASRHHRRAPGQAGRIIAIDINESKVRAGPQAGRHRLHQPEHVRQAHPGGDRRMTDGGVDFSFECIGNVKVMRAALECCHKGWGESVIIGVAGAGQRSAPVRSSWSPAGCGAAAPSGRARSQRAAELRAALHAG